MPFAISFVPVAVLFPFLAIWLAARAYAASSGAGIIATDLDLSFGPVFGLYNNLHFFALCAALV